MDEKMLEFRSRDHEDDLNVHQINHELKMIFSKFLVYRIFSLLIFDCVHCPALTFCEKSEQQATLHHST
jgi:hypothetical protein